MARSEPPPLPGLRRLMYNTSVIPALPAACQGQTTIHVLIGQDDEEIEPVAGPARRPRLAAASVAAVAGALCCAAAARAILRRRPASQGRPAERVDALPLLREQRALERSAVRLSDGQARLEAILRQETLSATRGVGMLPLRALPAALAHQLPMDGGSPARPAATRGAGHPAVEVELGPSRSRGALPSRQWGLDTTSLLLQEEELQVRPLEGMPALVL